MVKIKLNKIVILSFVIMLLVCNITFADQKSDTYLTMQDFLNSIGIDVMDCTNIEYINVNTALNTMLSDTTCNAISVNNVFESGIIQKYIVMGLQEKQEEYAPTSFNHSDISVCNTGSRAFAPAELRNAPIYLTLQTTYTTNGSSRQINPSGIKAYYSLSGAQQAMISALNCRFTVYGAPLKGTTYINYAPPGYTYDGLRTGYEIICTFSPMSPDTTYSTTKLFPTGYYINVDHPVIGGSTYEVNGSVTTSDGLKTFNVYWSGL